MKAWPKVALGELLQRSGESAVLKAVGVPTADLALGLPQLADHPMLWRDSDGGLIVTAEPYADVGDDTHHALESSARRNEWQYQVAEARAAMWNPDMGCLLLVVMAPPRAKKGGDVAGVCESIALLCGRRSTAGDVIHPGGRLADRPTSSTAHAGHLASGLKGVLSVRWGLILKITESLQSSMLQIAVAAERYGFAIEQRLITSLSRGHRYTGRTRRC